MLLKILGWIWLVCGVFFLIKPQWLQDTLKKKSIKKTRKYFAGLALFFGILLIRATWGIDHVLARIVMVLGVIGIFKSYFLMKAKTAEQLINWFTAQSTNFFRAWAVGLIVFGAVLLTI